MTKKKKNCSIQYHSWTSPSRGKNGKSHSGRFLLSVQFRSRSSKYLYSKV